MLEETTKLAYELQEKAIKQQNQTNPREFKAPERKRFESPEAVDKFILSIQSPNDMGNAFFLDAEHNKENLDKVERMAVMGVVAKMLGNDSQNRKEMNEYLYSIQRPL